VGSVRFRALRCSCDHVASPCSVDGPYGNTNRTTHRRYPILVFVGGGIGITPVGTVRFRRRLPERVNADYVVCERHLPNQRRLKTASLHRARVRSVDYSRGIGELGQAASSDPSQHYGWFSKQFEQYYTAYAHGSSRVRVLVPVNSPACTLQTQASRPSKVPSM
jgi:hypothetical protein